MAEAKTSTRHDNSGGTNERIHRLSICQVRAGLCFYPEGGQCTKRTGILSSCLTVRPDASFHSAAPIKSSAHMPPTPVLVTGGCGFLGTAIVSHLLSTQRFAITVLDINPPSPHSASFPASVRYLRANVLDPDTLATVFADARPEIVVHAVGVYPLGRARYLRQGQDAVFAVNVDGTRNVVRAAAGCGARGLVFTSSVTVVFDELDRDFGNVDETWPTGRADTAYGMSKVGVSWLFFCTLDWWRWHGRHFSWLLGCISYDLLLHPPLTHTRPSPRRLC